MLLRAEDVARQIAGRTLFEGVTLDVRAGDRIGLVGANGSGKSTLLRMLAGDEAPDAGRLLLPRGTRVGRLRQEIDPDAPLSIGEEVATALAHLDELEHEYHAIEAEIETLGHAGQDPTEALAHRWDELRARFAAGGGFERESRVARILAGLGFAQEDRARPLASLSGGWRMRVELAKLLLSEPDVLLLDEPTNHLDLPAIEWLESFLDGYGGAVVAVSHDRTFLRRHVNRIAELVGGGLTLYTGAYDQYLEERAGRIESAEAQQREQAQKRAEVERFVDRFRAKASKARQVQSRVKMLERMERAGGPSVPQRTKRMRLQIPEPARAGEVVLSLEGIAQRYGDRVIYERLDFELRRGDRVALVGPNGAGKSTLLRIAAGRIALERGVRRLGHNVRAVFYAQHQLEALDPERTVLAELERDASLTDIPRLRDHLGSFLFSGDDVQKKVSVLSGGEKARVALAKLFLRPANFLVLDEPTNHLDVSACEVLEDALRSYAGTLLFVTHDRALVNAVAGRVVEVRAGKLRDFHGNYDDYLRRLAAEEQAQTPPLKTDAGAAPVARESHQLSRERRRAAERAAKQLARIEAEIGEREKAIEALRWRGGDPAVYRDGEQMRALEAERVAEQAALDALYRQWTEQAEHAEAFSEPSPGRDGA